MSYRTLAASVEIETVIQKSRFLSYAAPVADKDEAEDWLVRIRAEHPFATHVCYAYVSDTLGNVARFSDDGEPKGTAGMPMLDVLRKQDLCCVAVAVVRYFGGIKLGAGGLVRAYAGAVADVLSAGTLVEMREAQLYSLHLDYVTAARVRHADETGREYGDDVKVTFATFSGADKLTEELGAQIGDRVTLVDEGSEYRPVPIDA